MQKLDSQQYLNLSTQERFEFDKVFYQIFKEKKIENDLMDYIPHQEVLGGGGVPVLSYNAWHNAMRGACAGANLSNIEFLCLSFGKFLKKALEENKGQQEEELKIINLLCKNDKVTVIEGDKKEKKELTAQSGYELGNTKVRQWLGALFIENNDFDLSKPTAKILKLLISKGISVNEVVSPKANLYLMNALSIKGAHELVKEIYKDDSKLSLAINGIGFGSDFSKEIEDQHVLNKKLKSDNVGQSISTMPEVRKKTKIVGSAVSPLSEAIITGNTQLLDWFLSEKEYWQSVLWNDSPALTCVEHLLRTDEAKNSKRMEIVRQIGHEIDFEENKEEILKYLHDKLQGNEVRRPSLLFARGLYFAAKLQLTDADVLRILRQENSKESKFSGDDGDAKGLFSDKKSNLFSNFTRKLKSKFASLGNLSGELNNDGLFEWKKNNSFSQKVKKDIDLLSHQSEPKDVYERKSDGEKEKKLFKAVRGMVNEESVFKYIEQELALGNEKVVVDVVSLLLCVKNVGYFDRRYSLRMNNIELQNTIADSLIKNLLKKYPENLLEHKTYLFAPDSSKGGTLNEEKVDCGLSLAHIACLFDDKSTLESLYLKSDGLAFAGGAMGAACLAVESGSKRCTELYVNLLINAPAIEFKKRMERFTAENQFLTKFRAKEYNFYKEMDLYNRNPWSNYYNDNHVSSENKKDYIAGLSEEELLNVKAKETASAIWGNFNIDNGVSEVVTNETGEETGERKEHLEEEKSKAIETLKFDEKDIYYKAPSEEMFVQELMSHALMFINFNAPKWQECLNRLLDKYPLLGTSSFGVSKELKIVSDAMLKVFVEIFENANSSTKKSVNLKVDKTVDIEQKLIEHYYWGVSFAKKLGIDTTKVEEAFNSLNKNKSGSAIDVKGFLGAKEKNKYGNISAIKEEGKKAEEKDVAKKSRRTL